MPHNFQVSGRGYVVSYNTTEHCPPERMSLSKFGVLRRFGSSWKCCTCATNKLNCPHKHASQAGLDMPDFSKYQYEAKLTRHLNDDRTYRRLTCESRKQVPSVLEHHQAFAGAIACMLAANSSGLLVVLRALNAAIS